MERDAKIYDKCFGVLEMCKNQSPRHCIEVLTNAIEELKTTDTHISDEQWVKFFPGLRRSALGGILSGLLNMAMLDHAHHDPDAKTFPTADKMLEFLREQHPEAAEELESKLREAGFIDDDGNDIEQDDE